MIFINIEDLKIDTAWQESAARALKAVSRASAATRSQTIDDNQEVWKSLKPSLAALKHQKCWYCESIDSRSDNAVDHYRPKNRVRGCQPPHEGYWWLAFDWRNYRFSCTYCNSIRQSEETHGGKHDYFPLRDESKRVRTDEEDIDNEEPLLLDPTNPLHIGLLAFGDDGAPGPAVPKDEDELAHLMAKETITRYHLDQRLLCDLRADHLRRIRKSVNEADKLLARHRKDKDPRTSKAVASRLQDILAALSPKAAYSAAVKHVLAGMATKSEAARKALERR